MLKYLVKDHNSIHILSLSGSKSWLVRKKLNCELIFLQWEELEACVPSHVFLDWVIWGPALFQTFPSTGCWQLLMWDATEPSVPPGPKPFWLQL